MFEEFQKGPDIAPKFPVGDTEWLQEIGKLKSGRAFDYYANILSIQTQQSIEAILGMEPKDVQTIILREQLIGEVRGLRRLTQLVNADEQELRDKLKTQ